MHLSKKLAPPLIALLIQFSVLEAAIARQLIDLGQESTWQGTIDLGPSQLRLQFQFLRRDDGSYTGKLISVDQGNTTLDLDTVEISDRSIKLTCKKIRFEYAGTLDESLTKISGTMTQGAKYALNLSRIELPENLKHVETWKGGFKFGAREFDFQIRIFQDETGRRHGKLDSFSESLGDLAIEFTSNEDQSFDFELPVTKAVFVGKRNEHNNRVEGTWQQAGHKIPLNFDKVDLAETRSMTPIKRPQNPKKPYPYRELEVQIENSADKVTLSGTLTLPTKSGKYPAAILISGSGGQDRNESLLGHQPFLILADHLTRAGFAVLRYDDRGISKSTGDHGTADSRDFARDTAAAIDFLKGHAEIDAKKIGLIGHSEGGLIAPMVATTRDDVAFIVMLAGPGVTGREIVLNQTALIEKAEGISDEIASVNREFLLAALEQIESGKSIDEVKSTLRTRFDELRLRLPEADRAAMNEAMFEQSISQLSSPWFRFFFAYDPRPALRKLRCPVLAINGELDLQVDPKLNLLEIRKALEAGGNTRAKVIELPGLNHLLQTAKTGSPSEYQSIEETMSPVALQTIANWLQEQLK